MIYIKAQKWARVPSLKVSADKYPKIYSFIRYGKHWLYV